MAASPVSVGAAHPRNVPTSSHSLVLDKSVAVALLSLAILYSVITVFLYRHVVASDPTLQATNRQAALRALGDGDPLKLLRFTFPLHVTEDTMEGRSMSTLQCGPVSMSHLML